MNKLELGGQAVDIISKIANGSCRGLMCRGCVLGEKHTNLCNDICRLNDKVEEGLEDYED